MFDRLVLVDTGAAIPPQGKGAFHAMAERVENGGMEAVLATALQRMFPDDFLATHQAIAEERKASLRATESWLCSPSNPALYALRSVPPTPDSRMVPLLFPVMDDGWLSLGSRVRQPA